MTERQRGEARVESGGATKREGLVRGSDTKFKLGFRGSAATPQDLIFICIRKESVQEYNTIRAMYNTYSSRTPHR
jgi:hypothetical protein